MVLRDALIRRRARQKCLSAAGVACEIVRLDRAYDDYLFGFCYDFV